LRLKNGQTLSADLVIDASGKASNISKWLEGIGHRPPSTWSVNAGLKYAYCMYEMTEDADRDWLLAMCMDYPQGSRVGMMIPIETNKWQVWAVCMRDVTPAWPCMSSYPQALIAAIFATQSYLNTARTDLAVPFTVTCCE